MNMSKKRYLSLLLATSILCNVISPVVFPNPVYAVENGISESQLSHDFTIDPSGTITQYNGKNVEISIPSRINNIAVKAIGDNVFKNKNLTKVELPESLTTIGKSAFEGNKLTNLYIPDSVTTIDEKAFLKANSADIWDTNKTLTVTGMRGVKELKTGSFGGMYELILHAPSLERVEASNFTPKWSSKYGKGKYVRLYTDKGTSLQSIDHVLLVNPAVVKRIAVDKEGVQLKSYTETSPNFVEGFPNTSRIKDFYMKGQEYKNDLTMKSEQIAGYRTPQEKKNVGKIETIEKEFYFTFDEIDLSAPAQIKKGTTQLSGFASPGADVTLSKEEKNGWSSYKKIKTVKASQEGKFTFDQLPQDATQYKLEAKFGGETAYGTAHEIFVKVGDEEKPGIKKIQMEAKDRKITVHQGEEVNLPKEVAVELTNGIEETRKLVFFNHPTTDKLGTTTIVGSVKDDCYGKYGAEKVHIQITVIKNEKYVDTNKDALHKALSEARKAIKNTPTSKTDDGADIARDQRWIKQAEKTKLEQAIEVAQKVASSHAHNQNQVNQATDTLKAAIDQFNASKQPGTKKKSETKATVKVKVTMPNADENTLQKLPITLVNASNRQEVIQPEAQVTVDKMNSSVEFTFKTSRGNWIAVSQDPYIICREQKLTTGKSENVRLNDREKMIATLDYGDDYPLEFKVVKGVKLTLKDGAHGKILKGNERYLIKGEHLQDFVADEKDIKVDVGYYFSGWSLDGASEIDLHKEIQQDTVLIALYKEDTGTINENTEFGYGWKMKHFTFDKAANGDVIVTGFSALGKERNQKYYDVYLPTMNMEGEKVKIVGAKAFMKEDNGINITNVTIPEGYEQIYTHAFYANNEMVSITFPSTMKFIGGNSFLRCGLKKMNLNQGLEIISEGAFAENKLYSITVPKSVKTIGANSFADNGMNEVIFDKDGGVLESIGSRAFYNNGLQYVLVPKTLKDIDVRAFELNSGLTHYQGKVGIVLGDGKDNPHHLIDTMYHVINPEISFNPDIGNNKIKLKKTLIEVQHARNSLNVSEDGTNVPKDEKYMSASEMKKVEYALYAGYYAYYDTATGPIPVPFSMGGSAKFSIEKADQLLKEAANLCQKAKSGTAPVPKRNQINIQLGIPQIEYKDDVGKQHEYVLVNKKDKNARKIHGQLMDVVPNTAWFHYFAPDGEYRMEAPLGMIFYYFDGGDNQEHEDSVTIKSPQAGNPELGGEVEGSSAKEGVVIIYDLMNEISKEDKGTSEDPLYETVLKGGTAKNSPKVTSTRNGKKFAGWSIDGKTVIDITQYKVRGNMIYKAVYTDGKETDPISLDKTSLKKALADAKKLLEETTVSVDGSNVEKGKKWATKKDIDLFKQKINDVEQQVDVIATKEDVEKYTKEINQAKEEFSKKVQIAEVKSKTETADKVKLGKMIQDIEALRKQTFTKTEDEAKHLKKSEYWVTQSEDQSIYKALVEANWIFEDQKAGQDAIDNAFHTLEKAFEEYKKVRKAGLLKPDEDPKKPGEDPKKPGEDPKKPGEDPKKPGEDPKKPGEDPKKPGEDPKKPGEDPKQSKWTVNRLSADNRQQIAVNVSKKYFSNAKKAIVVNNLAFADALSATNISGGKYPILYTKANAIFKETLEELKRLNVNEVFVMGGTTSVGNGVRQAIKKALPGAKLTEIKGADRYVVNIASMKYVDAFPAVVITNGVDFADALTATPLAQAKGGPVLLTKPNTPKVLTDFLAKLDNTSLYLVGGTRSIPTSQENTFERLLGVRANRTAGADRYVVSASVASTYFKNAKSSILASGALFSDALVAAPVSQKLGAPILLTRSNRVAPELTKFLGETTALKEVLAIGGPRTIQESVLLLIQKASPAR